MLFALLCFLNGTHLEVTWFWSELDVSPARQEAPLPFKLQLILFCHKSLAGLPLMSREGVDQPSKHLLRYALQHCWQRHPTTSNLHVMCCVRLQQKKKSKCVLLLAMAAAVCCSPDTPIPYKRVV